MELILIAVLAASCAIASAAISTDRKISTESAVIAGLFLGPLGVLVALASPLNVLYEIRDILDEAFPEEEIEAPAPGGPGE